MKKYIMALDQGTTSSRCILFEKSGKIAGMVQREFAQIFPEEGWVEHDPMTIWSTQISVATEALLKIGGSWSEVYGIGITNQRETTVVWDRKTGVPIYNAIVWQCRRTADFCHSLADAGYGEMIKNKTGLLLDPYFSASKLHWILENVDGAREPEFAHFELRCELDIPLSTSSPEAVAAGTRIPPGHIQNENTPLSRT